MIHPEHAGHHVYLRADNGGPHYCGTCHQPSHESTSDGWSRLARIKALIAGRIAREADTQGALF